MNNQKTKILIADDEPDILEFLKYNLKSEGFEVFTAENGKEAVKAAVDENPDMIILDISMPVMDGFEACRIMRNTDSIRDKMIVFLTARDEDYSQIIGFEAGADDYISKPIRPRVFISRIKALMRRTVKNGMKKGPVIAGVEIDREKYLVFKNGKPYAFPRKEFELLSLLFSKPGKVFTREDIMNNVWGKEIVVGDRTIDVHIRKIREKIGDTIIRTIKGVGYKFDY